MKDVDNMAFNYAKNIIIFPFLILLVCLLGCKNNDFSKKCGNFSRIKTGPVQIDTIFTLNPNTLKESRTIIKQYVVDKYEVVCIDTLNAKNAVYVIGVLDDNTNLFLLSEQSIDFYPYK